MRASQTDYILRMIEQLGAALRRMRELLSRGAPAAPEVLSESERAQAELFGALWPVLQQVDPGTAVSLVKDERQVELWIELLRLQASARRLMYEEAEADRLEDRADQILIAMNEMNRAG